MNTKMKVFLAIIGGIDIAFYILSPILIAVLWVAIAYNTLSSNLLFVAALFSSLFRGIKIGFLKDGAFKKKK